MPTYLSYDLEKLDLLPRNWKAQLNGVIEEHAKKTLLDGSSVTSREAENADPVQVYVVSGSSINRNLKWLHDLYSTKLIELAEAFSRQGMVVAENLESSININVLRGKGSRYEWHVDSNPVTGLLFATTHEKGQGGELVFQVSGNEEVVYPKSGTFLVFDAREIPHTVLPLKQETTRISVPMNFYFAGKDQIIPDDLPDYLYSEAKENNEK